MTALRPRPNVEALPGYVPGRSAQAAIDEHHLDSAIKLASNELSLGPLPAAIKAIERAAESVNRYPDNQATSLRSALADRLGVGVDRVAIGCGSVGLIQHLCLAYAGPGDEVMFGDPSFEAYPVLTQLAGATAVRVPLRRQTIDVAAMATAITSSTRLILLATPNNPTGTALRTAELIALADAVPETCLLVVDEAYHEFTTGADVPDAVECLRDRENVAVLRTFSKAYGLAGLRVGYAIAPPEVVAALSKTRLPFSVSAVAQAAALASLADDGEMRDRAAAVAVERDRVAAELRGAGFSVPDPQGNFVWLPAGDASATVGLALERLGVVTRVFPDVGIRVTTGTSEENDLFLKAFALAADDAVAGWQLPTGAVAELADSWLRRLAAVEQRLTDHAAGHHQGLTEPDAGGDERWEAAEVWGHMSEFGRYWFDELDRVIDGAPSQPFGRTKIDDARRAAVAAGPARSVADHAADCFRAIDALRARLSELTTADWAKRGLHSTLGEMDIATQLQHFHIGHYEEHLDQLDGLGAGGGDGDPAAKR